MTDKKTAETEKPWPALEEQSAAVECQSQVGGTAITYTAAAGLAESQGTNAGKTARASSTSNTRWTPPTAR